MVRQIPAPVIAAVAEAVAELETHASMDVLFMHAGAPGDPPLLAKQAKALAWLRRANDENEPMTILGRLIEGYMEVLENSDDFFAEAKQRAKNRISDALARYELAYVRGGKIAGALASPSRTLEFAIRKRDLVSINEEYDRALQNVESNPREAASAACNILESICKIYIEDEGLAMPPKQDLQSVWSIVRKDLGFDPSKVEDKDLQRILSGLISVADGIGALRTHASSAHGRGKTFYRLEPRHARLAVHSAHTLCLFVLESWDKKDAVD